MNEDSKLSEVMSTLTYLIKGPNILDVGTGFGTGITVLLNDKNHKVTSIDPEAWSFEIILTYYELVGGKSNGVVSLTFWR